MHINPKFVITLQKDLKSSKIRQIFKNIASPKSGHIKTFFPLEPDKTWTKNGGGNRTRTGESRFCRPLPYHLAMPPYGAGNGI